MKRLRPIALIVVSLVLVVGVAWWWVRKTQRALPPIATYTHLPPAFQSVLQRARAAAEQSHAGAEELSRLARLYQANGLYREAASCYAQIPRRGFQLTANDHYLMADVALNQGDLPAAQSELVQTLAEEKQYLPAHLLLAETRFKSGDPDGAETEYEAALKLDAEDATAALGLVRIDLQRGRDDRAVVRLDRLMAAHPDFAAAASLFAQVLERRGEKERSEAMRQLSRQKIDARPSDPWLDALVVDCYDLQRLSLRIEQYLLANQMDEALPLLDRIEQLDPKSWIPHLLRGWTRARGSHHSEAVAEYQRALELGGDPDKLVPLMARSYAGNLKFKEGLESLRRYYEAHRDSVTILTAYADLAVQAKQPALARELLTQLLAREPYLYTPNMNLANILWSAGEKAEAVVCLQRVAKVFPVDVASRGLLGQYFLENGDPVNAIPPLEQALPQAAAESPAHVRLTELLHTACMQVGETAMRAERFSEAAEVYAKAMAIWPTDLDALAGRASACVQLRQFGAAAEALKTLLSLQPDNPTIHLSLGDVLYQNGDVESAKVRWQRAMQLASAGKREDLRQALERRLTGPITPEIFQ